MHWDQTQRAHTKNMKKRQKKVEPAHQLSQHGVASFTNIMGQSNICKHTFLVH